MFWSVLTVIANILSVGLIIALVVPKFRENVFSRFFSDNGMLVALVVAFLATAGSLIYSDVIGYEPCKLCWFQRIFMYPQVIILGMALVRKDMGVKIYSLVLSVIGAAIALFHYVGQLGWNPFGLECLAVGYSASCSKNFVLSLGYVTIPMMALSAFILMALTLTLSLKRTNTE